MARPTKYTPARAAKIIEGLKAGMTRTAAAGLVDVSVDSIEHWTKRFASFAAEVEAAEGLAEARYTQVLAKWAFGHPEKHEREVVKPQLIKFTDDKGRRQERVEYVTERTTETHQVSDWRAAESWLKRRHKTEWTERNEVSGPDGKPIAIQVEDISAQLEKQMAQYLATRAREGHSGAESGSEE